MSDEMCGLGQFFGLIMLIILAAVVVIFAILFSIFVLVIKYQVKVRENNYSFESHKLIK